MLTSKVNTVANVNAVAHVNHPKIMLTTGSRVEYLRRLSEAEFDDALVLRRDTAEEVLTEKRMELVAEIANGDVPSMRELARRVDRDISIVSRDLDVLFEASVIDFEHEGRSKRPVLAHENVMVEPVVFEGEANHEEGEDRTEVVAD